MHSLPVNTTKFSFPAKLSRTGDEYPARPAPAFQISLPVALSMATTAPVSAPACETTKSPTTSGEHDMPYSEGSAFRSLGELLCQSSLPLVASLQLKIPSPVNVKILSPTTVGVARGPSPIWIFVSLVQVAWPKALCHQRDPKQIELACHRDWPWNSTCRQQQRFQTYQHRLEISKQSWDPWRETSLRA